MSALPQHAFFDSKYTASFYNYLNGYGKDINIHNLTCSIGSFLLDGKLAVSLSGSDMLGKSMRYSTNTSGSEFMRYSDNSLGKYYLLNIAYRFSKKN